MFLDFLLLISFLIAPLAAAALAWSYSRHKKDAEKRVAELYSKEADKFVRRYGGVIKTLANE